MCLRVGVFSLVLFLVHLHVRFPFVALVTVFHLPWGLLGSQTAMGAGVGGAAALVLFRGGMGRAALTGFGGGWGAGNIWAQASKEFEALEKKSK